MTQSPDDVLNSGLVEHLRYISAVAIVTLLYDHLLTLDQEVRYVWKANWTAPKFIFLLVRYLVPCAILLTTYQLGGVHVSPPICKKWFGAASLICLITTGPGQFLVMLWSWISCERNRQVMLGMLGLFVTAQIVSFALCIYSVIQTTTLDFLSISDHLNLCYLTKRGVLPYLFVPGLVCEGMGLLAVFWNSLQRPRKEHVRLFNTRYEDGFMYVVILFAMQLASMLIALYTPPYLIFFCITFTWSVINTAVTRLILNLRKHAFDRRALVQSAPVTTERPRVHFADQ